MIKIGTSPNRGLGVFANTRFKKGDVVTTYPNKPSDRVDDPYRNHSMFGPVTGDRLTAIGVVRVPAGHMINDAATPSARDKWPGLKVWLDDIKTYMTDSLEGQNVTIDFSLDVKATKRIGNGHELFFSYGPKYWTTQQYGIGVSSRLFMGMFGMTPIEFDEACDLLDPLKMAAAIIQHRPQLSQDAMTVLVNCVVIRIYILYGERGLYTRERFEEADSFIVSAMGM